ncbi:MAG: Bax inhibitor-1/YccA family protein [Candidatus Phytoplasma pruni]|nr:Bax inhibitor-1/YccA family protein [Candidatus Phytoplasma pruni]
MTLHKIYFLIFHIFSCLIAIYIILKTKYLDFIIDPSSRFYKSNFKTYINNKKECQQSIQSTTKKINQISQKQKIIDDSQILTSYKSVFQKLTFLILLTIISTIISYLFLNSITDFNKLVYYLFIFFVIIIIIYFIYFICYCLCNIYVFTSLILRLYSFLNAILYGIMLAFLYRLEYLVLTFSENKEFAQIILKYFLLFFVFTPLLLTLIIIIFISFLYKINKIKVNSKFHSCLRILFIVSIFSGSYWMPDLLLPEENKSFWFLMFNLLESFFILILYTLIWVNYLHQLDRFIEQKIPKKYEWVLVYFLFEAFVIFFIEILFIILDIVNYFLKKNK